MSQQALFKPYHLTFSSTLLGSGTGTVFTSTESIMRDNPTESSSVTTDENRRRGVVSLPASVTFAPDPRERYLRPPSGAISNVARSPFGVSRSPSGRWRPPSTLR